MAKIKSLDYIVERGKMPMKQRRELDCIVRLIREYVEEWYKECVDDEHSFTTITLTGNRFKATNIEHHFKRFIIFDDSKVEKYYKNG